MPLDNAGNTLNTALNVNLNSNSQSFSDWIGVDDTNDYYGLNISGRSSLNLALTNLSANVNIDLLNSSGGLIARSENANSIAESINRILDVGNYYVRVYQGTNNASTNYSLSVAVQSNSQPDIVWRNSATGENLRWQMNGDSLVNSAYFNQLASNNWKIEGTGDFNRDGQSDIVWRNSVTGENSLWYMNGTTVLGGVYFNQLADTNWKIAGVADFNRDGQSDIVWRNSVTGENSLWYMNNATVLSGVYFNKLADPNWKIEGTADFNRDGQSDIVWRNSVTGENSLWYMNNATVLSGVYFSQLADPNWKIAGIATRFNEPTAIDVAGNLTNNALNIGTLNGSGSFRDRVDITDSNDYYRFNVATTSDFTLSLNGLSADANVQLLDSNGAFIQGSTNTGTTAESISRSLNAGNYYVRVYSLGGGANYNLNLSATPNPIYKYNFTYYYNGNNTNSDYYTGYVYAKASTYQVGGYYDYNSNNNETGVNGKYYINSSIVAGTSLDAGKVFVDKYYDVDTSHSNFAPYNYSQGKVSGTSYLGSESDFVTYVNNIDFDFGHDAWELDYLPPNHWKAEYFNNRDLAGSPVSVENLGDGSQNLAVGWGNGSPSNTPTDNFSARFQTSRYFAPGLYHITTNSDDGVRVWIGNERLIDQWKDQPYPAYSGYFRSSGGYYPVKIEYYEGGGSAAINFKVEQHQAFQESVNWETSWNARIFHWDGQTNTPPANFAQDTGNEIGTVNLGSNTRSDGNKGINSQNWGTGAPNGDNTRLPHDFFAVRAHTRVILEAGHQYKAWVRSDDGYQLFANRVETGEVIYFTPQNQWMMDAYGAAKEVSFTVPANGWYDVHFQMFEGAGDAYFDLAWQDVTPPPPSLPPVMTLQEFNNWVNLPEYTTRNPFPSKGQNCTWYAHGRLMQIGYSEYALDSMWGNAGTWDDTASRGAYVSSEPQVGSIAVWEAYVNGAGSVGHVGVVERVNADGTILISESNWSNTTYNTRTISKYNPSKFVIVPKA